MDMLINLTKISKLDTKHVSVIIQPSKKLVTTSLQNDATLSFSDLGDSQAIQPVKQPTVALIPTSALDKGEGKLANNSVMT